MLTSRLTRAVLGAQRGTLKGLRSFSVQKTTPEQEKIIEENWKTRCELATAYRALEMYGLNEGICNHVSTKTRSLTRNGPIVLLIPYGIYWSEVTPECLVGLDVTTSKVVEGHEKPDLTAYSIHLGIYRNRPDVNCVVHTHGTYSTILSALEDSTLKMVHQTSTRFAKNVAYDEDFGGLSMEGFNDEGDRIGKTLGDKEVLLMGSHGITTVGKNIATAFDSMYYFEKAAQIQIMAYQTGKPLKYLSDDIVEKTLKEYEIFFENGIADIHLAAMKKLLVRQDPDFINRDRFNYESLLKK